MNVKRTILVGSSGHESADFWELLTRSVVLDPGEKGLRRKLLVPVDEPLFPRYFFIRLDAGQQGKSWNPIRYTTGVSRLVSFGNVPAKVDNALVSTIQAQLQAQPLQQSHFAPCEQLRINQGPFAGLEAIYQMADGIARVMVLIEIMSKQVRLSIEPGSLSKRA